MTGVSTLHFAMMGMGVLMMGVYILMLERRVRNLENLIDHVYHEVLFGDSKK